MPDGEAEEFLADWQIEFEPSTRDSALLAGQMYGTYLRRRPRAGGRVIPDFLIGRARAPDCRLAGGPGSWLPEGLLQAAHRDRALMRRPRTRDDRDVVRVESQPGRTASTLSARIPIIRSRSAAGVLSGGQR